ncbi:hypothetical protein [Nocardia sp. NPDC057668]|uniref:hypothetical protein n=1 Tax=Nocardia sp. NPDC057668 TaxID=3346202 RepID=UPI00366FCA5B
MELLGYVMDAGVRAELYDATELTANPAFWSYHLCGTVNDADQFFGVSDHEFLHMRDRLTDTARWPVLPIPLADGHEMFIVYENYELTPGTDYEYETSYLLRLADSPDLLALSTTDMHGSYAGIRWPELAAAAAPADTGGIQRTAARLLSLLPILGDAALPLPEATEVLAKALRAVGATDPARQATALLTDREFCGDESWSVDAAGVWTCDEPSSRRHAANRAPGELAAISHALLSAV